jgi:hypothetical protein
VIPKFSWKLHTKNFFYFKEEGFIIKKKKNYNNSRKKLPAPLSFIKRKENIKRASSYYPYDKKR